MKKFCAENNFHLEKANWTYLNFQDYFQKIFLNWDLNKMFNVFGNTTHKKSWKLLMYSTIWILCGIFISFEKLYIQYKYNKMVRNIPNFLRTLHRFKRKSLTNSMISDRVHIEHFGEVEREVDSDSDETITNNNSSSITKEGIRLQDGLSFDYF